MKMTRRQFLKAASALVAAPAIVKAENLMPIVPPKEIETLGSVDVWVSDFATLDVVQDASLEPGQFDIGHGAREDLADIIYDISPHETPFLSAQGRGQVPGRTHEWVHDELKPIKSFQRKPIKRRTVEEALEAALQDAWKRGGDPDVIRMSPELRDYFARSRKYG